MVTINGKEYGLEYTARARIAASNWIAIHSDTASVDEFRLQRAVCMINAYNKKHGINETVKVEDFLDISNQELEKLYMEEKIQFEAGTKPTVEAVPKKGKNAKSTAASS